MQPQLIHSISYPSSSSMSKLWQRQSYNSDTLSPTTYTQSYIFLHQSYNSLISPTTYNQPHINLTPSIQHSISLPTFPLDPHHKQNTANKFKSSQNPHNLNSPSISFRTVLKIHKFGKSLTTSLFKSISLEKDTISSFLRLFQLFFIKR